MTVCLNLTQGTKTITLYTMGLIKNFATLATNEHREKALAIVEAALSSIQPSQVLKNTVTFENSTLTIRDVSFDLHNFERVFLVGFGKGSSGVSKYLENLLGERLTAGFDIDVVDEVFEKIQYTKGTHPLPSSVNIDYTQQVLENLHDLTEKDLVLVVICGGGSALFESATVPLETLTHINDVLLKSGATISEMNVVRKHVSKVKGGKFAKQLYPATVASLIFSDVPGNDLSVIASGPTAPDTTTKEDLEKILHTYQVTKEIQLDESAFSPTVSEEKYFKHVHNVLVVSNKTALTAMREKAEALGFKVSVFSDRLQGDAKSLGQHLIERTKPREVFLAGGESTIHVTGSGKGGRNQALVLASLPYVGSDTIVIAFDSDGWDFYGYAGAIGDAETLKKAQQKGLVPEEYLDNDDSYTFFEKVGDGIDTGKLESNVSDLFVILKHD